MEFYAKRTVDEQAQRLPLEYRDGYKKSHLDRITMFNGTQELEVTGYAEYSYLDEKSYKTQPVRTQDGAIQEIEEYATFLTPRLVIKYNMMGIDDYRTTMKMLKSRNAFIIKCYDIVEDKIVKNEMYAAPSSMPRIYQQYLNTLGIQEHAIELIGTNVPIDQTQTILFFIGEKSYNANFGMSWYDYVSSRWNAAKNITIVDGQVIDESGINPRIVYNPDYSVINPNDYIFTSLRYVT